MFIHVDKLTFLIKYVNLETKSVYLQCNINFSPVRYIMRSIQFSKKYIFLIPITKNIPASTIRNPITGYS